MNRIGLRWIAGCAGGQTGPTGFRRNPHSFTGSGRTVPCDPGAIAEKRPARHGPGPRPVDPADPANRSVVPATQGGGAASSGNASQGTCPPAGSVPALRLRHQNASTRFVKSFKGFAPATPPAGRSIPARPRDPRPTFPPSDCGTGSPDFPESAVHQGFSDGSPVMFRRSR